MTTPPPSIVAFLLAFICAGAAMFIAWLLGLALFKAFDRLFSAESHRFRKDT